MVQGQREDVEDEAGAPKDTFNIRVCVRFRPETGQDRAREEAVSTRDGLVTIPLHQRLRMIQVSHKCSAAEARRILWGGEHGEDVDPWSTASISTSPLQDEEMSGSSLSSPGDVCQLPDEDGSDKEPLSAHRHQPLTEQAKAGLLSIRPDRILMSVPKAGLKQFR